MGNNYNTGVNLGINSEQGFLKIGQLDDLGNRTLAMVRKPDCFYIPNIYNNLQYYIDNGHYIQRNSLDNPIIVKEPLFISKDLNLGIVLVFPKGTVDYTLHTIESLWWGFFDKNENYITDTNIDGWTPRRLSNGTLCVNYSIVNSDFTYNTSMFYHMWNKSELMEVPLGFYIFTNDAEPRDIYLMYGIYHVDDKSIHRLVDNLPSTWSTRYEYTDILYNKGYSNTYFNTIDNVNTTWKYENTMLSLENSDSITQGGINDGSYDNSSDDIEIGTLPSFNAVLSNMISIYSPTVAQIQSFASFLWSQNFNEQIKQNWIKPLDMIISSHILPFNITTTGAKEVQIGGIDTGLTALTCNQYAQIDCGTLKIDEYYANFMDYNATKIKLYLPFVGIVDLSTNDAMGSDIRIVYNIDCMNGEFICFVKCTKKDVFSAVTYSYTGNMSIQVPITNVSFMQKYGQLQQVINGTVQGLSQMGSGNVVAGVSSIINSGINYAFSQKAQVNRTGGTSTTPYYMGILKPYLILERPIASIPKNYNQFNGYCSNVTFKLSQLKGFTVISNITFENMNLTNDEKSELLELCQNGIYL